MQRACERYTEIFREPPRTHGAAGWQMNVHALRLTQRLGFDYCSDGRGTQPHLPIWRRRAHPLPAVADDAAHARRAGRLDGVTEDNVAAHLLERTPRAAGRRRSTRCMRSSRACGCIGSSSSCSSAGRRRAGRWSRSARLYEAVEPMALPRCDASRPARSPGARGTLLVQGAEFLGDVDLALAA